MAEARFGLGSLAALGAVAAVVVLGLVVWAVRAFSGSDSGTAGPLAPTVRSEEARDGMHAQGTDELRRLGCSTALVMDMQRVMGDARALHEGDPRFIVTCDVAQSVAQTAAPSCERVASAYFSALGGAALGDVDVRVSRAGGVTPLCSRRYAASGAELGTY